MKYKLTMQLDDGGHFSVLSNTMPVPGEEFVVTIPGGHNRTLVFPMVTMVQPETDGISHMTSGERTLYFWVDKK